MVPHFILCSTCFGRLPSGKDIGEFIKNFQTIMVTLSTLLLQNLEELISLPRYFASAGEYFGHWRECFLFFYKNGVIDTVGCGQSLELISSPPPIN